VVTRGTLLTMIATALALAGCGGSGEHSDTASRSASSPPSARGPGSAVLGSHDVVFFGVGASTNPDVGSAGSGIAVAEGLLTGHPTVVARNDRWVAAPDGQWLAGMRLLANRKTTAGFTGSDDIVELRGNRFERVAALSEPFSLTWLSIVSPDGRLVAATEGFHAGANGLLRQGRLTAVSSLTGQNKRTLRLGGPLLGWVGAERLAFLRHNRLEILDLRGDAPTRVVSLAQLARDSGARRASIPPSVSAQWLAGSADGTLVAVPLELTYAGPHPLRRGGVVALVRISDHAVRLIRSPLHISMFAFAPRGDRYAYTTSGFPDPHELWVGSGIKQPAKRIYFTPYQHFDWITWSPDARWLLVDDQLNGPMPLWRVIPSDARGKPRTLPRLGGHPLWCCPAQAFFGA
jgi:hypothetical protein